MWDLTTDPVLQDMAREKVKRLPDHKIQSLEDDLRLNGESMAADEVSKVRYQRQQARARSQKDGSVKSSDLSENEIEDLLAEFDNLTTSLGDKYCKRCLASFSEKSHYLDGLCYGCWYDLD